MGEDRVSKMVEKVEDSAANGEESIHKVGLEIRIPILLAQEIEFGDSLEDYTIIMEGVVGELLEQFHAILEQELGIVSTRKVVVVPKIIVGDFIGIEKE